MPPDTHVVLIAGGHGALGQAVVPAFVQSGSRVVVVDRRPSEVRGGIGLGADVTDEADIQRAVQDVQERAGPVYALVNLVGGFATGRVVETDTALWQRMLAMNLTSAFVLSKAVLPHMMERGAGRIIHVAARAAVDPFPGAAAYIVAKAGLVSLIKTLAVETAGTGITVNGLLPTTIDTPANRTAMPDADTAKWVHPESIARLLLFLVSPEARQLNGALIPIG
ncbi:MAG: SDR family NAD(P)-dependent oxidoreductase [Nitrospiraceae bacterium]|nr:SDR family NAD(P)-dependent oxidoreductase [Nitrospiraceae bacterium]